VQHEGLRKQIAAWLEGKSYAKGDFAVREIDGRILLARAMEALGGPVQNDPHPHDTDTTFFPSAVQDADTFVSTPEHISEDDSQG
jgi:hypothetical protein